MVYQTTSNWRDHRHIVQYCRVLSLDHSDDWPKNQLGGKCVSCSNG